MVVLPEIVDMLKSGVHFGHKKSRRHPKMEPYIFAIRNEVHVIDLDKTLDCLNKALEFVKDIAKRGGVVLFVGTKKQAQNAIEAAAQSCGMPYINHRWIGGTLTNFAVISKLIKKFKKMKEKMESGELAAKYTKKEQLDFSREIDELRANLGGIQDLTKMPDAMILVDLIAEGTALREARKRHVPTIALCDTNVNPELIDYPVPSNDDAIKAIELMMNAFSAAIQEGSKERVVEKEKEIGAIPVENKVQKTKASALKADEHHAAVNL
ncbi:MAG: 30S ribosomal protein S2 [Patescibacteria group bacterium]